MVILQLRLVVLKLRCGGRQIMLGMRPVMAQSGQAPLWQAPTAQPQPAGPRGPAPSPTWAVPNAGAQPSAAAHSNLLQQLRAMQQQHARSPQAPQGAAPVFRPNPGVSAAVPGGGHHVQQPGNQPPSGGHHAQQPGNQLPSALQNVSEGAPSQGKPPPQLINS